MIGTEKSKPRTQQQQGSDEFDQLPTMTEDDCGRPYRYPLERDIEEQHG